MPDPKSKEATPMKRKTMKSLVDAGPIDVDSGNQTATIPPHPPHPPQRVNLDYVDTPQEMDGPDGWYEYWLSLTPKP